MNIEHLKQQRQNEIEKLYIRQNGRVVQRYSAEIHAQEMAAINGRFNAGLGQIMATAQERRASALATLERLDNPFSAYSWLSGEDATRAAALSDFIRADFAAAGDSLDVTRLMGAVVATGDKAISWLAMRHAEQAYQGREYHPLAAVVYRQYTDQLKTAVLPPETLAAVNQARQTAAAAEDEYNQAERHSDAWKQTVADSMGVNVNMIDDPIV